MIYCVDFAEVVAHLRQRGFRVVSQTPATFIFFDGDSYLSLRKPNVNGHTPENLMLAAFDAAGLDPPGDITVFYCD